MLSTILARNIQLIRLKFLDSVVMSLDYLVILFDSLLVLFAALFVLFHSRVVLHVAPSGPNLPHEIDGGAMIEIKCCLED